MKITISLMVSTFLHAVVLFVAINEVKTIEKSQEEPVFLTVVFEDSISKMQEDQGSSKENISVLSGQNQNATVFSNDNKATIGFSEDDCM